MIKNNRKSITKTGKKKISAGWFSPIGIQKSSVNIKKHKLGSFNRIDHFTELAENLVKLLQSSFIHAVKEAGKGCL